MRWYYLWQLRRANRELSAALKDLPDNWTEDVNKHAKPVVRWALAHCKVTDLLKKV